MNLAVHGLEGRIAEAITYYQDEHSLVGKCDFVMTNPPFNVDLVDAGRVKGDPRLPFGLPGVNKQDKVGNANYLWISYFWSYLSKAGRAGFVMSSQASSAGHGERDVRRKLVETGDVDVMISIWSNFFYTRTVPCELWHLDRAKPPERRDQVLMLDARNVYRKITRKIYDFSPEQQKNLAAIVWLYRGEAERYLGLVRDYLEEVCAEGSAVAEGLEAFGDTRLEITRRLEALAAAAKKKAGPGESAKGFAATLSEYEEASALFEKDEATLLSSLDAYADKYADPSPDTNATQKKARKAFDPLAESCRDLVKQVDLLYKLASRAVEIGTALATDEAATGNGAGSKALAWDRRAAAKLVKELDEARKGAVEGLKRPAYLHRQVAWLQDRFPKAEIEAVPGLVRVVSRAEIEAADWSLTPGRYVGVAPVEEDEDFDFEQTLRDIHTELADLNREAVGLAATIAANFEELGI